MDSCGWYKGLVAGQRDCCLRHVTSLHLRISNKNKPYCACIHLFNTNSIHNCMQLKLRDLLKTDWNLPNEIKTCRICTSNVNCGSDEMVSGATGGEFSPCLDLGCGNAALSVRGAGEQPPLTTAVLMNFM